MRAYLFGAACFGCAVIMAVLYLVSPRTVTRTAPAKPIADAALAEAVKADPYDEATAEVGPGVQVTCRVYTNDPDAVDLGATPKLGGWFVQACAAQPVG